MAKFRKKPVVIEAVPARDLINAFEFEWSALPEWAVEAYERGIIVAITQSHFTIKTLEGDHRADVDDMVIRGVKGEVYPCKPDIFASTYEPAE